MSSRLVSERKAASMAEIGVAKAPTSANFASLLAAWRTLRKRTYRA